MVAGVRGGVPGPGGGGLDGLPGSCASTSMDGWPGWVRPDWAVRVASWVRDGSRGAVVVPWRPVDGDGGRVRGAERVSGRLGHARHGNG